jgi:hypothetical protein
MDHPDIALAVPFEGHVLPTAVASLLRLVFRSLQAGVLGSVTFSEGGVIDGARNHMVTAALRTNPAATHVLWTDPGLVVPEDAALRLLAAGHQAVGASYPARAGLSDWPAFDLEPLRPLADTVGDPRQVGGVGLGCALIEADLYHRLESRHRDRSWHKRFHGRNEAVFFFERCRELGTSVWFEPSVRCERASAGAESVVAVTDGSHPPSGGGDTPRVAILTPLLEPVPPLALMSLVSLLRHGVATGLVHGIFLTDGLFYDTARNTLAEQALAAPEGFTHLLWVDSDMVVPSDLLDRLLGAGKPVAGGLYHTKRADLHPAVFGLDPVRIFDGPFDGSLQRVDGFGLGCALVRRDCYEAVAERFGDRRWHALSYGAGEDMFFFARCKKMGVEVWLDTSLQCGHVRDDVVRTADWAALQAEVP